jgi:hypothetical protein
MIRWRRSPPSPLRGADTARSARPTRIGTTRLIAINADSERNRVFRISRFPVFRFSGFPVFRFSGFPVFRFSGFPVFRFSGFPDETVSNYLICK